MPYDYASDTKTPGRMPLSLAFFSIFLAKTVLFFGPEIVAGISNFHFEKKPECECGCGCGAGSMGPALIC
uniref:MIP37080p1 n=1 Tax=Drosophila melanogaster TaxID=7227 RepID=R9UK25_DROME|nr:MIP37080p1 [Drosophila melanogaster]